MPSSTSSSDRRAARGDRSGRSRQAIAALLVLFVAFLAAVELGTREELSRKQAASNGVSPWSTRIPKGFSELRDPSNYSSSATRCFSATCNSIRFRRAFRQNGERRASPWRGPSSSTGTMVSSTSPMDGSQPGCRSPRAFRRAVGADGDSWCTTRSTDSWARAKPFPSHTSYGCTRTTTAGYLLSSMSAFYGLRSEYRKVLLWPSHAGHEKPDAAHHTRFGAPLLPDSVVYRRARERLTRLRAAPGPAPDSGRVHFRTTPRL